MTLEHFRVETLYNKDHLDQTDSSDLLSHEIYNMTEAPDGYAEQVTAVNQFAQLTIAAFHVVVGSFTVHVGNFDMSLHATTTSLLSSISCKHY
jgi:hypothetical protein